MLLTATNDSHVRRKLCLCVFLFTIEVYQMSDKRKSNGFNRAKKIIVQLDMHMHVCMLLWYETIGTYFKRHTDTDLRRVVWIAVTHNLKRNLMGRYYHTLCEIALYANLAT